MRISMISGPGAGKDTVASAIFHKMKVDGYSVEFVTEYVKQWTYVSRKPEPWDQPYLFGKQLNRELQVIRAGFDHLITSSPIMLNCYYGMRCNFDGWNELLDIAKKFEEQYPALYIFLERSDAEYDQKSRFHTEDQSKEIDKELIRFLGSNIGDYIYSSVKDIDKIYDAVTNGLKN